MVLAWKYHNSFFFSLRVFSHYDLNNIMDVGIENWTIPRKQQIKILFKNDFFYAFEKKKTGKRCQCTVKKLVIPVLKYCHWPSSFLYCIDVYHILFKINYFSKKHVIIFCSSLIVYYFSIEIIFCTITTTNCDDAMIIVIICFI